MLRSRSNARASLKRKAENKTLMATPNNILVVHGPNLNLLGTREPAHYGSATLATINQKLTDRARTAGVTLETYQSNIEGELVEIGRAHV